MYKIQTHSKRDRKDSPKNIDQCMKVMNTTINGEAFKALIQRQTNKAFLRIMKKIKTAEILPD